MLRYSVPIKTLPLHIFSQILEALIVEWRNLTPRFASTPERRNENIKYLNFSSENRTNIRHVYSHTLVPFFTGRNPHGLPPSEERRRGVPGSHCLKSSRCLLARERGSPNSSAEGQICLTQVYVMFDTF